MKSRQSKKSEYHRFAIQIPLGLWEQLQLKAEAEDKSYSAFIVELIRDALKKVDYVSNIQSQDNNR